MKTSRRCFLFFWVAQKKQNKKEMPFFPTASPSIFSQHFLPSFSPIIFSQHFLLFGAFNDSNLSCNVSNNFVFFFQIIVSFSTKRFHNQVIVLV